jgi:hypothetical protein
MRGTALSLLLLTTSAQASDWTEEDTYRQLGVYSTLLLDYSQTKDIKNHPNLYEKNPILGKHPTDKKINKYFLSVGIAHTLVAYNLPPDYRKTFQYATIGIEIVQIVKNRQLNLRFEF